MQFAPYLLCMTIMSRSPQKITIIILGCIFYAVEYDRSAYLSREKYLIKIATTKNQLFGPLYLACWDNNDMREKKSVKSFSWWREMINKDWIKLQSTVKMCCTWQRWLCRVGLWRVVLVPSWKSFKIQWISVNKIAGGIKFFLSFNEISRKTCHIAI